MIRALAYLKNFFFRSNSIRSPDHWFNQAIQEGGISNSKALKVATVYACNKILSETIGTLPLKCYERTDDGGKAEYSNYFLAKVFKKPNILQTQSEFFENLVTQINLRGNYYAGINYDRGYISEFIIMNSTLMQPKIENNKIIYQYSPQSHYEISPRNPTTEYSPERILHVKNLTIDGLIGLSPISYAKKAVNLSIESEDHGYRYFANGTRSSGFIKHPAVLKDSARKNLEKSFQKKMSGENKFKIQILEEGMEFQAASLSNEDSQYLQTREFQVRDVARWYGVPLELLQEPSKTGVYANREQFMQSYVVFTIRPWLIKIEQRINTGLVPIEDQDRIFFEFNVDGLLRGDIRSRYGAYAIGRQWGWLSADDIRRLENQNPIPNNAGKKYLMPLNMEDVENPRKRKGEK